ncbi:MAG: glycosyltransferase family 2 protein [Patescibacteria group bacterium]
MDISVVIVSWNVKEQLRENLKALYASQVKFSWEVFVVDNASEDGSQEMLKEFFPGVKLIANDSNLGFAKANNIAIRQAQGRFILLLNPDMRLQTDTLEKMLDFMANKKSAVVAGARLLDREGKVLPQVRNFPTFWDQALVILKLPHLFPGLLSKYLQKNFDYSQASKVASIRGSFFLIDRLAYQAISGQDKPLLDERYFVWFEEVDFCRQVYKLGGEVWYNPEATALDLVGQSFKQIGIGRTQSYFQSSMLAYFQKWEPAWQYRVLSCLWPLGSFLAKLYTVGKKILAK